MKTRFLKYNRKAQAKRKVRAERAEQARWRDDPACYYFHNLYYGKFTMVSFAERNAVDKSNQIKYDYFD